MQIRSLRLEEFKSYTDAYVEFTPGTNAIVGHNGAGKSSILEAIGFTLFDYTPPGYTQSDFVKEGAKTATITVNFLSSLDEREYQVVRRCGSSSYYNVYDPELDKKICEGKADVLQFLCDHLGVDQDTNLPDLFANAVGVPQGMLTSAFLETHARRKPIFDPLLRVEEYRKAYDQLREPGRVLEQHQAQLDVQISGLEARLERLPALESSIGELTQTIATGETELRAVERELVQVQQDRQTLENLRRRIADLHTVVGQARQQVANWEGQLRAAEERVAEAAQAQELVEAHREGHEAYQAAQAQQRTLEEEARRRQTLRDRLSEQDKRLSLINAEQQRQESTLAEIQEAERAVTALATAVAEQERLEAALRAVERRAARLEDLKNQLHRQKRMVEDAELRLAELQAQLRQAETVNQFLTVSRKRIAALQQSLDEARERQGHCKADAERLKTQIASLEEGDGVRCPVCEQPLDEAHRRDLLARNEKQLADLRQEWRRVQQDIKQLDAESVKVRDEAQTYEETLRQLPRAEENERTVAQVAEGRRELAQLEAEVDSLTGAVAEAKILQQQLTELGNPRRDQEVAAQKVARRDQVMAELAKIEAQLAEQKVAVLDLQTQLKAFADLDKRIAVVAGQIKANREADDLFRRNEQLAESLPRRQQDAELAQQGLSEACCLLEEKEESHRQLAAQFDEACYHQLSGQEQHLRSRQGSLQGQLAEQRKRLAEQEAEIERLRERQAELAQVKAQRARLQQQAELLNYLRNILRDAGPYVTRALVRQISHEAAQLFGEIMQDYSRRLRWNDDYSITLEADGYERQFSQLSGGEQMSAALAVRLALLREMSDIDVAFFDEPTTNLDETRRESLARQILEIKGFRQLFVISHDDTFEQATETLVRVQKINGMSVIGVE